MQLLHDGFFFFLTLATGQLSHKFKYVMTSKSICAGTLREGMRSLCTLTARLAFCLAKILLGKKEMLVRLGNIIDY